MKKIYTLITLVFLVTGGLIWTLTQVFRTPEIRHIVLISIDTCRADYLSCYGYPENTTPNIDALAREATRFEQVVSPAPITLAAHSSMLTGLLPPSHGVHYNHAQLASENLTLPEMLKQKGFHTAAIVSAFVLYEQFGLSQGFDSYDDKFKEQYEDKYDKERKGQEATQLALNWLNENKDRKSFLFLHYYDPHYDYSPPEPFASQFPNNPYAGEIAFTDHCVGQVIQKLKDLEIYDSTLLIVTGDHGEMLGEHGEETHSYFVYESAIKVPLIIKRPGQKNSITVSELTGLIDITPTICSLLDINPAVLFQGNDLSPFLEGNEIEGYERFLYSESVTPQMIGASTLMAISHGKWKYIQAPRPELYDIDADPGEKNNLIEQEPHRARILADKVKTTLEQSISTEKDSSIELDDESIKKLESLGYIAGKTTGELIFDEDKKDPKDMINIYDKFHKAMSLISSDEEFSTAREILEELIPQAPDFVEVYKKLGDVCQLQNDIEGAVSYYRKAYDLNASSIPYPLLNDLAWIQATHPSLASADVQEALDFSLTACKRIGFNDPYSLDTLAVCYAAVGDFDKATETARKAIRLASVKDKKLAQEIRKRLSLFQQSKPYIEK
jgi:arylsulfatase A-like enzyme